MGITVAAFQVDIEAQPLTPILLHLDPILLQALLRPFIGKWKTLRNVRFQALQDGRMEPAHRIPGPSHVDAILKAPAFIPDYTFFVDGVAHRVRRNPLERTGHVPMPVLILLNLDFIRRQIHSGRMQKEKLAIHGVHNPWLCHGKDVGVHAKVLRFIVLR